MTMNYTPFGRSWDWIVAGYRDGKLVTETVHRGDSSKDIEVSILEKRDDIDRIEVRPWTKFDPNPPSDLARMAPMQKKRRRK